MVSEKEWRAPEEEKFWLCADAKAGKNSLPKLLPKSIKLPFRRTTYAA